MSSIAELAKNLHNAGKAAGITRLRVTRFAGRGVTPRGTARYEGTVQGEYAPEHGEGVPNVHLFFWCESDKPESLIRTSLESELNRLNKEPGENND